MDICNGSPTALNQILKLFVRFSRHTVLSCPSGSSAVSSAVPAAGREMPSCSAFQPEMFAPLL
jgi:hypothetical protein